MSYYEDLTRIRVSEVIQDGLKSQGAGSGLGRQRPSSWKAAVVVVGLAVMLAIFLAIPTVYAGM